MCGRFGDDSWISYPMGKLLDKQSKSASSLSSSSFMTEILKSVDRAPLSLDIVKSDQPSTLFPGNATSSLSPSHDIRTQSRSSLESAVKESGEGLAPDSNGSQVPMQSTSPPQQLMGSVKDSENPPSSQQCLNRKARRNLDLRGPNNWHHPGLLRDLARIIVSVSDRMEGNDQSIPEPGIASVVQVPTQAHSKAKADPALQKLEEMLKAEFGYVNGATPAKNPFGKQRSAFGETVIKLIKDHKSLRQRNFALTGDRFEALKAIMDQFLKRGWIAHSDSEWGSPAFVVPKKTEGAWRSVADYRGLNSIAEMDSYGIPLINSILQYQVQKRVFRVLDLKPGYHEMKLAVQSQDCTTMSTPFGTYKWLVMPIRVKNGNAAFQRLLHDVLKDYRDFAKPFADNIILSSGSATYEGAVQNHVEHLRLVLQRLRENKLAVSDDKANMFV